jgi:hypothetical protein
MLFQKREDCTLFFGVVEDTKKQESSGTYFSAAEA